MPAWTPIFRPCDPEWTTARASIDVLMQGSGEEGGVRLLAERAVADTFFARCLGSERVRREGLARAEQALERFDDEELSAALHGGSIGVAWCLQVVRASGVPDRLATRLEETLAEVDDAIGDALTGAIDAPQIGILRGLAGLGLYALERGNERLVRGVVGALDRAAVSDEHGRTFHTPSAHTRYPAHFPRGTYDLGLSHGIAGALCFLARAHPRHPSATSHALIEDLVRWLLAHERPRGHSAFPAIAVPDGQDLESDAGWAHGDAGVGFAIVTAGMRLDRPDWIVRGRRIVRRSLERPVESYIQAYTTTITHGCAGLAQIYGRLAQATGDPRAREGARRWLRRMLDRPRPDAGTLVSGALGSALVLMSALHGVEPAWDSCVGLAS